MRADRLQVAFAAPFSEGSILAIARAAAKTGQLAWLFTTLHSSHWPAAARIIPTGKLRRRVSGAIMRRSFSSIPSERIVGVARWMETLRVVSQRLPRSQAFATHMMYATKSSFDRAVAGRMDLLGADAVVTMMESGELTLKAVRQSQRLGVLNFVNSHPFYHNLYLRELAGLSGGHHEFIPDRVIKRVENELELADLVLVPSRFIANQLSELGLARGRVLVRPYGVDLSRFHPAHGAVSRRWGDRIRCLYLGQISHRKGIKTLLEAARRLSARPLDFTLVGPLVSPELLRDMPPNVHWLGPVGHDDAAEQLRLADLFVLPSLEDSYGLVAMEAMATGMAVVVSDHAGASELITDGVDGLIVPAGHVAALTEALKRLVDDQPLRLRMASAARNRVQTDGSWERYGQSVLELIVRERESQSKIASS
jgi:glycosyltransferase involved in cell wall biosynthesis